MPEIAPFLRSLASAGFDVVGAATRGGAASDAGSGPWALVLGNEEFGMAPEVAAACTRLVTVPGTGKVESLNVSAAAAILISEARPPRAAAAEESLETICPRLRHLKGSPTLSKSNPHRYRP